MTQTELGRPLSRAFVSAVEHGRCLPSLGVFALFAGRLDVSLDELLDPVKQDLAALYTQGQWSG
jgi:transcriptional regulator with XRE-family HTH domain